MADLEEAVKRSMRGPPWSGDDCVDVVLIWLRMQRDQLDDAIAKIEAVRPQQTPGA